MSGRPALLARRNFLRGGGAAWLALPALPSLLRPSRAEAAALAPKNFISFRLTNGFFGHQWYPGDHATGALRLVAPNLRAMALSDIAGPISPLLNGRFDAVRGKLMLLRHIDRLDKAGHGEANGLLGWSTRDAVPNDWKGLPPSIDKLMAKHAFGGRTPPLNLSVGWSSTGMSCSAVTTPQGAVVFDAGLYPAQAYEKLFNRDRGDPATARRKRFYQRNIVDRVLPHYQALRANARLSAVDRTVLDQHIEHMHSLHDRLWSAVVTCDRPRWTIPFERKPEQISAAARAQVDIAIAALRCGLARIVNFYFDPDSLLTGPLHGVEGGHHAASHDPQGTASVFNAQNWALGHLADFLTKLDTSIDPATSRTLLDQSLVLVNNEIGNQNGRSGNQADDLDLNHLGVDVQTLLAGSCGGALQTGKLLDYRTGYERPRYARHVGTAYNRVLITCMRAMGLQHEQWEVGGVPGYGDLRGGLSGSTPAAQVETGDLRAGLPGLTAG